MGDHVIKRHRGVQRGVNLGCSTGKTGLPDQPLVEGAVPIQVLGPEPDQDRLRLNLRVLALGHLEPQLVAVEVEVV